MLDGKLQRADLSERFSAIFFSAIHDDSNPQAFSTALGKAFNYRTVSDLSNLDDADRADLRAAILKDCFAACNHATDFLAAERYLRHVGKYIDFSDRLALAWNSEHSAMARFALNVLMADQAIPVCPTLTKVLLSQLNSEERTSAINPKTLKTKINRELDLLCAKLKALDQYCFCSPLPACDDEKQARESHALSEIAEVREKLQDIFDFALVEPVCASIESYSVSNKFFNESAITKLCSVLERHVIFCCDFASIEGWDYRFIRSYINFLEEYELLDEARDSFLTKHIVAIGGLAQRAFEEHDFKLATQLTVFLPREDNLSLLQVEIREELAKIEPKIKECIGRWVRNRIKDHAEDGYIVTEREARALNLAISHYLRKESRHFDDVKNLLLELVSHVAKEDDDAVVKSYLLLHLFDPKHSTNFVGELYDSLQDKLIRDTRELENKIKVIKEFGYDHLSYSEYERILMLHNALTFFCDENLVPRLPQAFSNHEIYQRFIEARQGDAQNFMLHIAGSDWIKSLFRNKFDNWVSDSSYIPDALLERGLHVTDPQKILAPYDRLLIEIARCRALESEAAERQHSESFYKKRAEAIGKFELAFNLAQTSELPVTPELHLAVIGLRNLYERYDLRYAALFQRIEGLLSAYAANPHPAILDELESVYAGNEFGNWRKRFGINGAPHYPVSQ